MLFLFFSGQSAQEAGRLAKQFAEKSWMFAQKQMKADHAKSLTSVTLGPLAVTVDSLSPKAQKMHKEVTEFVRELIIPLGKSIYFCLEIPYYLFSSFTVTSYQYDCVFLTTAESCLFS